MYITSRTLRVNKEEPHTHGGEGAGSIRDPSLPFLSPEVTRSLMLGELRSLHV